VIFINYIELSKEASRNTIRKDQSFIWPYFTTKDRKGGKRTSYSWNQCKTSLGWRHKILWRKW